MCLTAHGSSELYSPVYCQLILTRAIALLHGRGELRVWWGIWVGGRKKVMWWACRRWVQGMESGRQVRLSSYRPITSPTVQSIQSNIHLVFSINSICKPLQKHVSNFGKVCQETSFERLSTSGIPCHLVFLGHLLAGFLDEFHFMLVAMYSLK